MEKVSAVQQIVTLFVENLPLSMHWKGLWFAFARHGIVRDVFISRRLSKGGKRFGFVRFESMTDALRAVERLNGFSLYGFKISVALAKYKGKSNNGERQIKRGEAVQRNTGMPSEIVTSLDRKPDKAKMSQKQE
ncbi:hypothetical protein V6N13_015954 [Hibiscus sabdariffa]